MSSMPSPFKRALDAVVNRRWRLGGLALLLAVGYVANASWLATASGKRPLLLAHRGVHQLFSREQLSPSTCTAQHALPSTHGYIENTIPSMQAAFEAGADVVEIDVHPTTDGQFAVFHDWRLECRTEGTGVTRMRDMSYLKSLDVGRGYTSDGGKTFPLRGRGVGLMPTLFEVLDSFPSRRFLVNVKSADPSEADKLAQTLLARSPADRARVMVYGSERVVPRLVELVPGIRGLTRSNVKSCLGHYLLLGWTSYIPAACRNAFLIVPNRYASYLWGWPRRFLRRMDRAGTEVFLAGGNAQGGVQGIDSALDIPADYDGGIWTDRIEELGPALARARHH
jgi:glycerophosphoryl diester phosphodiesterase